MSTIVVRQAVEADVARILDLLTHYDQPQQLFEPWYDADSAYRPAHSWLVEDDGVPVAHLRIYPRLVRVGPGAELRVAGVGNVVTARSARGHGHADRVTSAAVRAAGDEGYAYSLLWTHLPALYARHGFGGTVEEETEVTVPPGPSDIAVRPMEPHELPAVAALQGAFDAHRQGTAVRDAAFWRESPRWLRDDTLVSTSTTGLTGYVRRHVDGGVVTVLELGAPVEDPPISHALLAAAAAPTQGRLRATLPRSLRASLTPWSPRVTQTSALMGRALSLRALCETLTAAWSPRLRAVDRRACVIVPVDTPTGAVGLRISPGRVDTVPAPGGIPPLDSSQLTSMLLRGCDDVTLAVLGDRTDLDKLATLAPADDFVLWQSDAF